jgi:hypothetical protein
MSVDDCTAASDVKPVRNTPRVLGSPQGHEYGDIVAVDDEIIAWLERTTSRPSAGSATITENLPSLLASNETLAMRSSTTTWRFLIRSARATIFAASLPDALDVTFVTSRSRFFALDVTFVTSRSRIIV